MGLFPPFIRMIRLKLMIRRSFGLLTNVVRNITTNYVSDYKVFRRQRFKDNYLFRINDSNCRLYSVRSNGNGKGRACKDRRKRTSTCIVKGSRALMAFFINHNTYDAFLNVNRNRSSLTYRIFTALIFTLLFRRARDRNHFNNYSALKSISSARLLINRVNTRFDRVILASIITYV